MCKAISSLCIRLVVAYRPSMDRFNFVLIFNHDLSHYGQSLNVLNP